MFEIGVERSQNLHENLLRINFGHSFPWVCLEETFDVGQVNFATFVEIEALKEPIKLIDILNNTSSQILDSSLHFIFADLLVHHRYLHVWFEPFVHTCVSLAQTFLNSIYQVAVQIDRLAELVLLLDYFLSKSVRIDQRWLTYLWHAKELTQCSCFHVAHAKHFFAFLRKNVRLVGIFARKRHNWDTHHQLRKSLFL